MNRLTALRQQAGLKQHQAADIFGVSRSTIAKWETGVSHPKAQMLHLIAQTYRCSLDDLLADESLPKGKASR